MKPYIDFDVQKRKEATTNEADKNHFKLLNNAVYENDTGKYKKKNKNKSCKKQSRKYL